MNNKSISKYLSVYVHALVCFLIFSSHLAADAIEKPFLWKIEGDRTTSYLFGTIHLPDARVTALHSSVEQAFKDSEYVYTEIPLDTSDLIAQVNYLMLEGDQTLVDIIEPELLQRANNLVKDINPILTIDPFLKFKVWALATSLPILEQQLNNPGVLPLDAQLYQRAGSEGKGTGGIETIQEQLGYFDNLSQDEEIKMLRDTIEFMETTASQDQSLAEEFIEYYLQGDVNAFGALMVKYVKEDEFSKGFMKKILHDRNIIMADRIHAKLKKNPDRKYFFAVGAGHYWGDTGIQKLLKDKGLSVSSIE
ncbi:MAG: TraB/GumN family protein [Gammaproteobacteria bacterium]|nr:TraB/GumN family protein [Gammaproteobacteria bacterium]NNC68771.1 TraB/GumN family protein [Gammaproteobacteria bacterium]